MIPNLNPRIVTNLQEWLIYELQTAKSDRAEKEEDWIRYAKVYGHKPKNKERTFPWKGAANYVAPVAATDIDTTAAGLMGTIFGAPNLWTCEGLRPDRLEFAARLEEFLEWAQEAELGMYDVTADFIFELVKLGTGVLKQRYRREEKLMWEWRESQTGMSGGQPQTLQQMVRRLAVDRPDVCWTPLANWYAPAGSKDVQSALWCAERVNLSYTQLEARVRQGIYQPDTLTKVGAYWRAQQPVSEFANYEQAQQALDHFLPSHKDTFEFFEYWTNFDILGTGEPVAVTCTIHIPSNTYARIDFNPFFHQEKPYSSARFLRKEGSIYGIGLCEMLEGTQEVVSAMECQRLDNGTLRNIQAFKGRRGSGVREDTPIWPGRIVLMENPQEDLLPLQMGFEAQSTLQEEEFLLNYASRRSGVSAWTQGGAGEPAISYSAATTTIEMLKQGKLRLDQTLREIQKALTETGQRVVELYQQFNQGGKPYLVMGDKDGEVMEQVLSFPLDSIRLSVAIKVTSTNAALNRETKIRTDQIILGLVMQSYQQMFQAMTVVVNPQVPPPLRALAMQMIQGGTILVRRILDAYGTQDLDQIIPDLEQLGAATNSLAGALPPGGPVATVPQPGAAGANGTQGPSAAPWLALAAGSMGGNNVPILAAASQGAFSR